MLGEKREGVFIADGPVVQDIIVLKKNLRVIILMKMRNLEEFENNRSNEVGEYLEKRREGNFDQECQCMDLLIFFYRRYDTFYYENDGKVWY